MSRRFVVAMGLACALVASAAKSDEVQFKNGDKITGKIERLDGDKLIITTPYAGEVKVNFAEIKTFSTDAPITIHLADGTVINQKIVAADAGKFSVDKGGAIAPQAFALTDVKKVNPPPVKWTGDISAGVLITRGNTYTDNANININLARRGIDDRITLNAAWFYGRQKDLNTGDKSTVADNWFAGVKYDYFFTEKFYGYAQARVERDRVAELDLRLIAGLGVGYQWVERPDFNFSTEAGPTWLHENYSNDTPTIDTVAARLAYHVDKKFNDQVAAFHNLQWILSLENVSDYFITTDAGVRATLTKSMFAEFKVLLNYDSTPAEGASRSDLRWILNVGWAF